MSGLEQYCCNIGHILIGGLCRAFFECILSRSVIDEPSDSGDVVLQSLSDQRSFPDGLGAVLQVGISDSAIQIERPFFYPLESLKVERPQVKEKE